MLRKIRVGITGQSGFIGSHVYNLLGLEKKRFTRVEFADSYFQDKNLLEGFVKSCDVIIHLAALNRSPSEEVIYDTNIMLVQQLIAACDETASQPHIIFSSSSQEGNQNAYGKSKKDGRILFEKWAKQSNTKFTSIIIPNVFGPFGTPFYNSVVATFCHQLASNELPHIGNNSELNLIYVSELARFIVFDIIEIANSKISRAQGEVKKIVVPTTSSITVSDLLEKLECFKRLYMDKGIIPNLHDDLDRDLFNTFLCYIDHASFFPFKLIGHMDQRGAFVEILKLYSGGQISFSTTLPGVTRGNHFHTRKVERFAVIKGRAQVEIRRIGTSRRISFELDGSAPSFVDMPIWFTHNITNIGEEELYTIFWINEHYSETDSDTYFEKV
jgi:UDP-2-acetamido-2,6-beta-L-arabino-hexul-4-ose reductase